VASGAEAVEAGRRPAEIDDREEERGERVEAEVSAQPGQAKRQDEARDRRGGDEVRQSREQGD
jgi:hypothetical protein